MSKSGAVALLLLAVAAVAVAQTVTVEYVVGTAEHNQYGVWEAIQPGLRLRSDVTIRLQGDAIVDLTAPSGRITLAAAGSFPLAELISDTTVRSQNRNLGAFLKGVITNLLDGPRKPEVAVLGARAGREDPQPRVEWVDEDKMALEEAKALLEEGRFDEALEHLDESERAALEPGPFRFLIGYTLAMKGETGPALETLRTTVLESSDTYYEDWIYLQAQLLFRASAHEESLTMANRYSAEAPYGKHAQSAMTLAGLSLAMLGRVGEARSQLERARDRDPESPSGQAAAEALSQLTS